MKKSLRKISKLLGALYYYHLFWAFWGAKKYKNPSKDLIVIGITGTKGKTTVALLVDAILRHAGKKIVTSSSVLFRVGDEVKENSSGNTMPGRGFLQKIMREGVDSGAEYAVLEVTSEGVVSSRHRGIEFDVAVFTGIHEEHIESHGSFEKYREAKLKFFRSVRKSSKEKKHFIINKNDSEYSLFDEAAGHDGVTFYDRYNGPLKLIGDFNNANVAAAVAVTRVLGINENVIVEALTRFNGIPGRMEFLQEKPFGVVIDYAHTPDSLRAVYETLSKDNNGKLICVLGSMGGGRDKWKRPKMGEIAGEYCDEIILTNEDPVDENPGEILKDIRVGIKRDDGVKEIVDRREAIENAILIAKDGDVVAITGKGREPYIRVAKGERISWSDGDVTEEVLAKYKS